MTNRTLSLLSGALLMSALAPGAVLAQPAPAATPPATPAPGAAPSGPAATPPASAAPAPAATPAPAPVAPPSPPAEAAAPATPVVDEPAQAPAAPVPAAEGVAQIDVASATPAPLPATPEPSQADEPNPLLPEGEEARMKARPVDETKIEFKPGKGLGLRSTDGDFELWFRPRVQWLYTLTDDHAADETAHSLQIRRLRLQFAGTAFGKNNKYSIELGLSGREVNIKDGSVRQGPVLDAYAEFDHLRDLTFRVGQYKVPFGRQRIMSEGNLQTADISLVTDAFTFGRDVGVDFRSKDFLGLGLFKYTLGAYTGQGQNTFAPSEFDMLFLARLDALPLGMFEDYQETDFERSGPRLALGVGAGYQIDALRDRGSVGNTPGDGGPTDLTVLQADLLFKVAGLSASTEFFHRVTDHTSGGAVDDTGAPVPTEPGLDGMGWYLRAGYLLPAMPLELVAHYGMVRGKDESGHDGLADTNELGGGLGYFIARHGMKVQADFFRLYESGHMSDGVDQARVLLQLSL